MFTTPTRHRVLGIIVRGAACMLYLLGARTNAEALVAPVDATPTAPSRCTCPQAKLSNGWCRACKVGYVASFRIKSELLWEVLDAHGHDIDPKALRCESCRKALATDGFCERSGYGFIKGKLYASRLTYSLAKGKAIDTATLTCGACVAHARLTGWCDACGVGMVGNTRFTNAREFQDAAHEARRLLAVLDKLKRCEMCAVAAFSAGRCSKCKIDYDRNGVARDGIAKKANHAATPSKPQQPDKR